MGATLLCELLLSFHCRGDNRFFSGVLRLFIFGKVLVKGTFISARVGDR